MAEWLLSNDSGRIWRTDEGPDYHGDGPIGTIRNGAIHSHPTPPSFAAVAFNKDSNTVCALDTHGKVFAFYLHKNRRGAARRRSARAPPLCARAHRPSLARGAGTRC
jgi:hypothetical protein